MATIFQVGVGSGGIAVLDLLAREPDVDAVTLVDPDVYSVANATRHLFPPSAAGRTKVALAQGWVRAFRPTLDVTARALRFGDPDAAATFDRDISQAAIGVCSVDVEAAKHAFDDAMRRANKPWTLGEVLAGGIAGFVHWFAPGGPCYGCVASRLKRDVRTAHEPPPPVDYADPQGAVPDTRVPASKTAIVAVAAWHAQVTLQLMRQGPGYDPGFTSVLVPFERVDGIFPEPFRPRFLRIARDPACLVCGARSEPRDLDAELDAALERLGDA